MGNIFKAAHVTSMDNNSLLRIGAIEATNTCLSVSPCM